MNARAAPSTTPLPQAVRAEAAAWIARLHSADRSVADEKSFRRWLAARPVHAQAFEQMTELWEAGSHLKSEVLARVQRAPRARPRRFVPLAAAATLSLFVAAGAIFLLRGEAEATRIGEQRMLTLEDGSRVTLNTATRIEVHFGGSERRVELTAGEALFEVARDPARPFVVQAGDRQVTALGTSFVVRQDAARVSVILVEGKVAVSSGTAGKGIVMTPGQRLVFDAAQSPKLDRPPMEKVTAWRQGLIALDNLPLADAVAEMNRYSSVQLVIADASMADLHVSGVFRSGDSAEFARALARTHGLRTVKEPRRIVISAADPAPQVR